MERGDTLIISGVRRKIYAIRNSSERGGEGSISAS